MKKHYLAATLLLLSTTAFAEGGVVTDASTNLIFDYDNISQEEAIEQLDECQDIAMTTQTEEASNKGSAVSGAAKGAAAGAAVGAISGNSGSDAAKTGATIGLVSGRVKGNRAAEASKQNNQQAYQTVLRNCMTDKHFVALN
ncbi:glycine zipper family protein [Vibrio sp. ZSDE26]|uniref:Glycine zipper family protein n=1 Tax=Vibrio amylolyticus TaxID=2847292 RepID=A0A9X1XHC8_9VIBR|nr:glycine zipper family protein [Vibrio amylolyticus]MCK6261733.1 glycine zipper family protein [Vibrio amylolyticus]